MTRAVELGTEARASTPVIDLAAAIGTEALVVALWKTLDKAESEVAARSADAA